MSNNHLEFTGFMREYLLRQVCREGNICDFHERLDLEQEKRAVYKGTCPFCGEAEFRLNNKTGLGNCRNCGIQTDHFGLIMAYRGSGLNYAMERTAWMIKTMREIKAEIKAETRERKKEMKAMLSRAGCFKHLKGGAL
jgi:hypothetical protein